MGSTNAMDINPADEEEEKIKGEPLESNMKKKNKNTAGDEDKSRIPATRVDVERKVSWKAKAPASNNKAKEKAKTGNAMGQKEKDPQDPVGKKKASDKSPK